MSGSSPAHVPPGTSAAHGGRSPVMAVVTLAVIVTSSSASSLNLALPSVAAGTGASQTQLLWIVDAYTVPMAGLLLAAGALGDRFGRRLMLVIGLSLFGAGALVASLIDSPEALIVCRLVMGIAGALILPTTLSIITTTLPAERRATAVGTWVGLAGAGAVVGMLSSALLLEWFEWNAVFVLTVVLVAAALAGAVFWLPSIPSSSRKRFDLGGAVLSLVGIAALVVGLLEGPDRGWGDALTVTCLVVAVVLPLSRYAPTVSARFGMRATMTTGFLISAAGFLVCRQLDVDIAYVVLFAGLIGMGMGVALVSTPATSAIVTSLSDDEQGVGAGLGQTARQIAGSVGIALIGAVLNSGYSSSIAAVTPPQTPAPVAEQAEASIVAAQAIASHADRYGEAINRAAAQAFVDGFHDALLTAIAISLVGAAYAFWRCPHTPATHDHDPVPSTGPTTLPHH